MDKQERSYELRSEKVRSTDLRERQTPPPRPSSSLSFPYLSSRIGKQIVSQALGLRKIKRIPLCGYAFYYYL